MVKRKDKVLFGKSFLNFLGRKYILREGYKHSYHCIKGITSTNLEVVPDTNQGMKR